MNVKMGMEYRIALIGCVHCLSNLELLYVQRYFLSLNSTLMISMIFFRLPKCKPMDTIVKVELGRQVTQVEEIIPSHIVVPRCSGLHSWKCGFNANEKTHNNKAKKCVSSLETSQEVKVSS